MLETVDVGTQDLDLYEGSARAEAVGPTQGTRRSAPVPASENSGSFGAEWHVPSVFWYIGGTDPDAYDKARRVGRISQDITTNHSPNFVPVIHPTLETGVEAMVVAARAWLS